MTNPEFDLYSWNTPNGQKIVIALEEAGADYTYHPIDISAGEQHEESFRRISPDGKIPALIHRDASSSSATKSAEHKDIVLFESGAILIYLANIFPILHGRDEQEKAQVVSWTFWQVGQLGPLAGQFGRFQNATPPNPQAVKHFEDLVWRCLTVMEKRLETSSFLASDRISIADIAAFPWIASKQSYLQSYKFPWRDKCPSIARWADEIANREAVEKVLNG